MDSTLGSSSSLGSSAVSKTNTRKGWGNNRNHRNVRDPVEAQVFKDSRDVSTRVFGTPNDPAKVKINDFAGYFKDHISDSNLTTEDALALVKAFPFARQLLDRKYVIPPFPTSDPAVYLHESRLYRLGSPMVDKLTKMPRSNIGADSTYLKFSLGIDTKSCLHVGAGKVFASSVSNAARYVDWLTGDDIFHLSPRDLANFSLIVSDAAIPANDGLGCGSYPQMVSWAVSQFNRGKYVIIKLILDDLPYITVPYHILHKPRRHNHEIIISMGIPGVSLDHDDIEENIEAENVWRNECVYAEAIPPLDDFFYDSFDLDLLGDDKDYTELLSGYKAQPTTTLESLRHTAPVDELPDPAKVQSYIEAGYFVHDPTFNIHAAEKSTDAMAKELTKLGRLETRGNGNKYAYTPKRNGGSFHPNHLKFSHTNGCNPAPHEYPVAMWLDLFPNYTAENIASHVAMLGYINKSFITIIQRGVVRDWKSLKKRYKGKTKYQNS